VARTRAPYSYHEDVNWGLLRLWRERTNLDVLDVGCGFATTSARIKSLGNRVTGVDDSPEAVRKAEERLDRVVMVDLQDTSLVRDALGAADFDAIIFADVLEHVAWPQAVLGSYLPFLRPNGRVLVSLPNVGLWSARLGHLIGRWDYQDTGVLDRTHLRFFTRRTARDLLFNANLRILARGYTPGLARPFIPLVKRLLPRPPGESHDPEALLNSGAYRAYLRLIYPLERVLSSMWPGLLAFQMIFEAEAR
jgi:2-polyprenyl-3-methyl-5-hydroxy-6-metoxy-1,4-benzoquinol methylase